MNYKLGSLFDGSGGFPLAGTLCGIEPVWAAEVEPYPIAVTRSRFPNMKHLGDISKVNGAEIEPVDIITFGSPCQDLSVAGKRAGLKHEANGDEETTRSGLFMEAVRIIKEMRNATNGKYPTFALWENVPGAFSSNKGEDFRIVCEELIKIVEPSAVMPGVPQKGWNYSDSYIGDGWSLAYRVLDAQYWGVPQRRRRIYLVADFRGERAREVLFEREGLRGYFTQGRTPWQAAPADAEGSAGANDREGEGFDGYNGDLTGDKSATLGVNCGLSTGRNGVLERGRQLDDVAYTLKIRSGCEGGGKGALVQKDKSATLATNNDQYLFQPTGFDRYNQCSTGDKCETLRTPGGGDNFPTVYYGVTDEITPIIDSIAGQAETAWEGKVAPCLKATHYKMPPCVAVAENPIPLNTLSISHGSGGDLRRGDGIGKPGDPQFTISCGHPHAVAYPVENHPADSRVNLDESGKVQTLTSRMGTGGGNVPMVMEPKAYEWHNQDSRITGPIDAAYTLNTNAGGREGHLVIEEKPVICLQGNGIDRADNAGCNGKGWKEDTAYTLNTIDRPAVAYAKETPICVADHPTPKVDEKGVSFTLNSRDYKAPLCAVYEEPRTLHNNTYASTLMARDYKGVGRHDTLGSIVCVPSNHYIVRRLTPTECARLQGFADWHGHLEEKTFLTDVEFKFWTDVRNTHAAINGKKVQEYTRKQMLTWYNKLWTDAAEYKMWGNGIALPTALYVVQGIADALESETTEIEDWML